MDVNRAKQILNSPSEIEVKYNGHSIWIEQLNESEATARVHNRENPNNEMTVQVEDLMEQ
ncbi:MAG: H-type small acid-soluble spore protein [Bacillaceae bacterium]|nr:H-type small acid-soluble spore protein [Bacillaceae bacterium]